MSRNTWKWIDIARLNEVATGRVTSGIIQLLRESAEEAAMVSHRRASVASLSPWGSKAVPTSVTLMEPDRYTRLRDGSGYGQAGAGDALMVPASRIVRREKTRTAQRRGSSVGWLDRDGAIHAGEGRRSPFSLLNRAEIIEKKSQDQFWYQRCFGCWSSLTGPLWDKAFCISANDWKKVGGGICPIFAYNG